MKEHYSCDDSEESWDTFDEIATNTQEPSTHKLKTFRFSDMKNFFAIDDFAMLYKSGFSKGNTTKKCIIMSSHPAKIAWDLFILFLLLIVCIVVPYRLAFYPDQGLTWTVVYLSMDGCFCLDIIITFFTSVSDDKTCTEIVDRKKIATMYLKGWFWIDSLSIFPFDLIASA